MTFKQEIENKAKNIEEIIYSRIPKADGCNAPVFEAMDYSVKAGGKRLRPMLMMETAKLFNSVKPEAIEGLYDFMAAIEFIHTYSLVHDDLPDMDNDLLRRGKATTHAVYGPAQAILAGDGLLNNAFEIMAASCAGAGSVLPVRAMATLAGASGPYGMVGGQSLDVVFDKTRKKAEYDDLTYIHENKCGKLIMAAIKCGSILAGASDKQQESCGKMGMYIGVAFQIIDDILDITGDEAKLGKPVGSDEKNEKSTMATLLGIEEAGEKARDLTDKALEILLTLPGDKDFLEKLFLYLAKRDM